MVSEDSFRFRDVVTLEESDGSTQNFKKISFICALNLIRERYVVTSLPKCTLNSISTT